MRKAAVDAIVEWNEKILLIKRARGIFIGKYALPGGRVDDNETTEEAVTREVKEETGVDVKPIAILGVYSDPHRDPREQFISTAYICRVITGSLDEPKLKAGDDAGGAVWVPVCDIDFRELAFDHGKILEDYTKWRMDKGTYWTSK